jgi:hypothetical protein
MPHWDSPDLCQYLPLEPSIRAYWVCPLDTRRVTPTGPTTGNRGSCSRWHVPGWTNHLELKLKVLITLEDTTQGIFPIIQWQNNGITDHMSDSLSMALAAQLSYTLKEYARVGAIKVMSTDKLN